MSRVPSPASPLRRARRSTVGLAFTGAILVLLLAAGLVQAVAVTVGFRDFAYDPGQASRATADAQQSKLWFANNAWYGGFYSSADNAFNIWRLNEATQTWADSSFTVDLRDRVHGDFLFDTAANKLYVVSTKSPCTSMTNGCNDAVNVYRFTFHPASALAAQYTLDAGFPVAIIGGLYNGVPPSNGGAETVTIAKDANLIYVAYTRRSAANAAPSRRMSPMPASARRRPGRRRSSSATARTARATSPRSSASARRSASTTPTPILSAPTRASSGSTTPVMPETTGIPRRRHRPARSTTRPVPRPTRRATSTSRSRHAPRPRPRTRSASSSERPAEPQPDRCL